VLRNGREQQWIAEDAAGRFVGQVRLSYEPGRRATIHVGIAPRQRGKGYGVGAICAALHEAAARGAKQVRANILSTNKASIGAFRRAGFRRGIVRNGVETWVLTP
jgi:RimJ/RimL family protein N-acetyltransferase